MSYSLTATESTTFTVTHARHMAAKVAADLKRLQRFYGQPSDSDINDYEEEVTKLLKHGYLDTVTFGFKRGGRWIEPSLQYTARDFASGVDEDPGKIRPNKDISGTSFSSFLSYTAAWDSLSKAERESFKSTLPFQRISGEMPGITGYLDSDRTYSSGSKALSRSTVRSY